MTYYFLFHGDSLLLTGEGRVPCADGCPVPLPAGTVLHRLPALEGRECRTASLAAPPAVDGGWRMTPLRSAFYSLPAALYKMAGKAREILHWDSTTRYCGVCGTPLRLHTDISKRCPSCGREVWPALSAAIIVAVTRGGGEEILLVQSKKFKRDYLGLVAGFVETGETLEECLRREVAEETGLSVANIRYFASQDWPYPCGLMMGFTAEYAGGELTLQRSELNKGGWYRRDNLPAIPGEVSLARRLIDHWRRGGTQGNNETTHTAI